MTMDFKQAGDLIYLIGESRNDIGSSEYLHKIKGVALSPAPYFNIDEEYLVQQKVLRLIENGLVQSAHDVAEGGLFTALIESAKQRNLGFDLTMSSTIRPDAFLFGEAQGRIVVSVKPEKVHDFETFLAGCPFEKLGTVNNSTVRIGDANWGDISGWKKQYDEALELKINA